MIARVKVTASSGQPKACIRLTRCMSMTLRERISELLSACRGRGCGSGAMDDVVLQRDGRDLEPCGPGPLGAAGLCVEGGGGQRADLLNVEHIGPSAEANDPARPPGDPERARLHVHGLRG